MKRYFLFAFDGYDSCGGLNDFIRDSDDLEELKQSITIGSRFKDGEPFYFNVGVTYGSCDGPIPVWYEMIQILDTQTKEVIGGLYGKLTVGKLTHKQSMEDNKQW